jgi:hypothetical protein
LSRDDIFIVRQDSVPAVGEGNTARAVINRMGMQVVTDFWDQLSLMGATYHMQVGTEDAGVNMTNTVDDQTAIFSVDNTAGNVIIPMLYEATPGVPAATAALLYAMIELDKEKVRYSSGGTAFTPEPMNGEDANSANVTAYITDGSDITVLAKSAVPDSMELARVQFIEDALADTIGYPGAWDTEVYNVRKRFMAIGSGVSSICCHFGSATALTAGYAVLQFAQLTTAQVQ